MPAGRPPGSEWPFDPIKADTICDLVAEGRNLHQLGILKDGTGAFAFAPRWRLYEWLKESPEFAENYERAREDRADWRAARIDSISERLLAGEIDPSAAKVAVDIEKWQAAHERPKRYGDKQTVEHTGPNGGALPMKVEVFFVNPTNQLKLANSSERKD